MVEMKVQFLPTNSIEEFKTAFLSQLYRVLSTRQDIVHIF